MASPCNTVDTRYLFVVHCTLYSSNTQLCSTILIYCTVHSLHLYIHTSSLYLHLKYITVHRTFSDQTLLYSFALEQYTFWGTVHTRLTAYINICSLFTPLTAAFPTVLYSSPRLFWLSLLSGKERKREKEEGRGRGKYFSAEIRNLSLPTLYCTHTV